MKLPSNFKHNIDKYFYDKDFDVYSSKEVVDDEGWGAVSEETIQGSFKGNVAFDNLAEIQQNYGIEEEIDITISTHEEVELGSLVGYDSVLYKIIRAIPLDSHNLLMGKKWK